MDWLLFVLVLTSDWSPDDEDELLLALLLSEDAQAAAELLADDELLLDPASRWNVGQLAVLDDPINPFGAAQAFGPATCATTTKANIPTPAAIFFMSSSRPSAGGLAALRP